MLCFNGKPLEGFGMIEWKLRERELNPFMYIENQLFVVRTGT